MGVSKNRVPQNGWYPLLKWMIWGYPLFLETPICGYQTPGVSFEFRPPQKNPKTSTKEFADGLQGAGLQGAAGHRLTETPRWDDLMAPLARWGSRSTSPRSTWSDGSERYHPTRSRWDGSFFWRGDKYGTQKSLSIDGSFLLMGQKKRC